MNRCEYCECSPCFLDCEERRQQSAAANVNVRPAAKTGVDLSTLPTEDRRRLNSVAKSLLRRGVPVPDVATELGLKPMNVSVIKYRLNKKSREQNDSSCAAN